MKAAHRWAIAAPVLLAVAGVAAAAWTTGSANVQGRDAGREIASWDSLAAGPRPDTIAAVRSELKSVIARMPNDAYAHELLGIVEARDRADPAALERAIGHFNDAIAMRPVSPYTWANLVHAHYEAGQTGDPFELAIRHARDLGPQEPGVQAILVNYGLAVREEVSPATRGSIDLAVASAMRRNPSETLTFSGRRGRLDVACAGVNRDAGIDKRYDICRTWENKP